LEVWRLNSPDFLNFVLEKAAEDGHIVGI
jgi:hypothetical protein